MLVSCKKTVSENQVMETEQPTIPFDTTAIDSFSTGSTSINVARKIEMSSRKYQDSLKAVQKIADAQKKAREDAKKVDAEAEKALKKEKEKKAAPENKKPIENPDLPK